MQISWLGAVDVGRLGTALPCFSLTDRWGKGGDQGKGAIIIPTSQVAQLVDGALGI